jgi:GTPase Era involved in 16S rRNA processing
MTAIAQSFARFNETLKRINRAVSDLGDEASRDEENILSMLTGIEEKFNSRRTGSDASRKAPLEEALEKAKSDWKGKIQKWHKKSAEQSKVRESIQKSAKGLVIAVFGRTNAGKSTLGNFIREKVLSGQTVTPIQIIEEWNESRKEWDEPKEKKEKDRFEEGATETTREIQLFSAPGFTWLDTPGFGSVNYILGNRAKDYVGQADMIVYLDMSDNPGLRGNVQILMEILNTPREICIAINHSDKKEHLRDASGKCRYDENDNPIKMSVAKPDEVRRAQEEQEKDAIRKVGYTGKLDAISISMLLAKEALAGNDDEKYRQSNLDALFGKFNEIMPDEASVKRIKQAGPSRALIDLIGYIVDGLGNFRKGVEEVVAPLEEKQKTDAVAESRQAIATAMNKIGAFVSERGEEAKNAASGDTIRLDARKIAERAAKVMNEQINQKASRMLKEIFDANARGMITTQQIGEIESDEIVRVKESYAYTISRTNYVEREASGFFETVRGWFGKKHYSARESREKRTDEIDFGFDTKNAEQSLLKKMEGRIAETIEREFRDIKEKCLDSYVTTLKESLAALDGVEKELKQMRSKKEKQCS